MLPVACPPVLTWARSLAAEHGSSKGSFYWFFANRDALIRAALQHWRCATTDQVAASPAELPDPAAKMTALLEYVFDSPFRGIGIALQADAVRPEVREVLAETHRRRPDILRHLLTEAGLHLPEAESTALSLHAVHLGVLRLRCIDPELVPPGADGGDFQRTVRDRLLPTLG
ncbi:hypothetical protein M878_21470 [Streptomyces roseochromogenus subsp. oscitans DS 12.976]|uniref:HTH tetR-type domain-containing protein n=1 Tax=Streptomyces roseochromogenus subsp. oscitans DS 12.976 TaxID=1352936 RepID=V6KA70_STRRC|nr:hypothetical protein M878_21470 [Streptomyces roseochromogenus subsp. oscitans DS 12.976]